MGQEQRRRHDGAVGEANGDWCPGDAVTGEDGLDVVRQDRRAGSEVGVLYGPVCEPMEERKSTVDGDGSSNTEDRRS